MQGLVTGALPASHTSTVELVRQFRQLRVLVLGDAMLDTYLEGTAARLCSEGPVPVVSKTAEYRIPGGAANTAANLRALDAEVLFVGMVGTDIPATLLRGALRERSISDQWLVEDAQMTTLHKLRILADGQYVVRFDEGGPKTLQPLYSEETLQRLLNTLERAYAQCDLVLVSDYSYGVACPQVIERLRLLSQQQPKVIVVDSKALHRFKTLPVSIVTPNLLEARLLTDPSRDGSSLDSERGLTEVIELASTLHTQLQTEVVAITLAEHGVLLLDQQGDALHLSAHPVAQANDVGAGDSFASALALALAAGGTVKEAAQVALDAASIAVTRQRTAVVRYQELLQRVSLREYAQQSENQQHTTALQTLLQTLEGERAQGKKIVFTNGVFDILHAGHVQFLRQAKALGDLLVVGLNSDSSTRRLKGPARPINNERDRMALVAALDVVDYALLFDEDTPTELIRQLRPALHVKGGDYADEALPEAEAVREGGGSVVILPLVGSMSTSQIIDRIVALAHDEQDEQDVSVPYGSNVSMQGGTL